MIRILIVDDELSVCDVLGEFLAEKGYETETAYSGQEALEILCAKHYDLMLLDLKMPGMSGLELLKKIRKSSYQVGVVVLTGVQDLDLAREVMKYGAIDYLNKPVDLEQLASTIDFAIKKQRIIRESSASDL